MPKKMVKKFKKNQQQHQQKQKKKEKVAPSTSTPSSGTPSKENMGSGKSSEKQASDCKKEKSTQAQKDAPVLGLDPWASTWRMVNLYSNVLSGTAPSGAAEEKPIIQAANTDDPLRGVRELINKAFSQNDADPADTAFRAYELFPNPDGTKTEPRARPVEPVERPCVTTGAIQFTNNGRFKTDENFPLPRSAVTALNTWPETTRMLWSTANATQDFAKSTLSQYEAKRHIEARSYCQLFPKVTKILIEIAMRNRNMNYNEGHFEGNPILVKNDEVRDLVTEQASLSHNQKFISLTIDQINNRNDPLAVDIASGRVTEIDLGKDKIPDALCLSKDEVDDGNLQQQKEMYSSILKLTLDEKNPNSN